MRSFKLSVSIIIFLGVLANFKSQANDHTLKDALVKLVDSKTKENLIQKYSKSEVLVLFVYMGGCPIYEKYVFDLIEINKIYNGKVAIVNLDTSVHAEDKILETKKHLADTKNEFSLVIDKNSSIAKLLKLRISSQIAVIRLRDFSLIYRGAINDRINLNFEKASANSNYLINTIDSVLAKKNIVFSETEAFGCEINLQNEN
jgi:hypothetical protein